ncbi:hypothetical protein [uncultured Gimesia sp.]|uniref:hypothetical protein n=1 Tax=uncultured Gimesia sp. TaxID=1678688 RepID=UPI0030DA1165|tara:strand:- start:326841 stop:327359 length:519 start_codon:yes stop_codon:yes gene_type:complete
MRALLVNSGILALVPFLIGFVISLFIRELTWGERLPMAIIPAFCTFVAAFLLGNRDYARYSSTMKNVRNYLLACNDSTDEHFLSCKPYEDDSLLLETRNAISQFFDVPSLKIRRDIDLIRDLQIDKMELPFNLSVIRVVIASRQVEPKPFHFTTTNLTSIDDLTNAILKFLG